MNGGLEGLQANLSTPDLSAMPQLVLQEVESELVRRLEQRAAEHGVTMEDEHRQILRNALVMADEAAKYQVLKDVLFQMPDVGEDADFERVKEIPGEVDFP